MSLRIRAVESAPERSALCRRILAGLPEWFGIESAVERYVADVAGLPTFAAELDGEDVGFLALRRHGAGAAEILVMGVEPRCHRRGAGRALVEAAERWALAAGVRYLQAKTLGPSRPSRGYEATRRFYEACGFVPLEELDGIRPGNPALVLVKHLAPGGLAVLPVEGLPEIEPGADLAALLGAAARFEDGDVLVVAQKAVSKAEGRIVRLADVEPTERAVELAGAEGDPRHVQAILDETVRIVRSRPPLVIAETRHGFVCASAGVDASNAPEPGTLVLLPLEPDASARRLRERLRELTGRDVAVIVSDSFGRPFRQGTTDVALGVAGLAPLLDLRGTRDAAGYELRSTQIAVADEIASAAELVRGKARGVPAAIVRGLELSGDGSARELVMPPERDLFR